MDVDLSKVVIAPIRESQHLEAKRLVLEGLKEHFGFLDESLNPDLDDIAQSYADKGHVFLTGSVDDRVVCCGALVEADEATGRIVRMSVGKPYRRNGLASRLIDALERKAKERGYTSVMLKTIHDWSDAVGFYESKGYAVVGREGRSVKMAKRLT
ncbi:GNAT family N-acetyltransferase [Paenibacillus flagellatus]|nr:GNAT family N-acetyltransferase [Paenibacillus flagellatus]